MKYSTVLLLILLFIASCRKKECDDTQACVINHTKDTVFYCWGCNYYQDTVLHGDAACISMGPGTIKKGFLGLGSTSSSTISFLSDHGDYFIEIDDCYEEITIE